MILKQLKNRKSVGFIFIFISIVLGGIFLSGVNFPVGLDAYFKAEYYSQFGPLAISIELLIAGIYLLIKHPKSNFALALFGFTAILDPLFNMTGLFTSQVPLYAMFLFVFCAFISLWLAFTNTYNLGRISLIGALGSFMLGTMVELFFNYLYQVV